MALFIRKFFVTAGFLAVLAVPPAQAVTPDELFEVLQRIESLENEIRYLRGENEQLRFDMEDIKNIQKKTFIRVDDRMDELFRAINSRQSSAAPLAPSAPEALLTTAKPEATKALNDSSLLSEAEIQAVMLPANPASADDGILAAEKQAYDIAFANIKTKPSAAISQFRAFLKQYPDSALAPNVQYWLGEVMFSSRNYQGAIDEFVAVLETYRESPEAPDAAMKLGLSFYEMKNWVFARRSLQEVVRSYPESPAAVIAKARLDLMQKKNLN